ncbi:MAG: hypothetical protein K2I40_01600, partial [Bifidobacterium castoris]|nr:hypothetical protein [Bifidobacterium castoris]
MEIKVTKRRFIGLDILGDLMNDPIPMANYRSAATKLAAEAIVDTINDIRLATDGDGSTPIPQFLTIT